MNVCKNFEKTKEEGLDFTTAQNQYSKEVMHWDKLACGGIQSTMFTVMTEHCNPLRT